MKAVYSSNLHFSVSVCLNPHCSAHSLPTDGAGAQGRGTLGTGHKMAAGQKQDGSFFWQTDFAKPGTCQLLIFCIKERRKNNNDFPSSLAELYKSFLFLFYLSFFPLPPAVPKQPFFYFFFHFCPFNVVHHIGLYVRAICIKIATFGKFNAFSDLSLPASSLSNSPALEDSSWLLRRLSVKSSLVFTFSALLAPADVLSGVTWLAPFPRLKSSSTEILKRQQNESGYVDWNNGQKTSDEFNAPPWEADFKKATAPETRNIPLLPPTEI